MTVMERVVYYPWIYAATIPYATKVFSFSANWYRILGVVVFNVDVSSLDVVVSPTVVVTSVVVVA